MSTKAFKLKFIKENFNKLSQQKIMKELKISHKTLIKLAKELDIYTPKDVGFVMTEENLEFIKNNYKKLGLKVTAEKLGCNQSTVSKYAKSFNLTRKTNVWTIEEEQFIKENWNLYSSSIVLKKLNNKFGTQRTILALEKHVKDLKIKSDITSDGAFLSTKDIMHILNFSRAKTNSLFIRSHIKYDVIKNKRRVEFKEFKRFLKENQHLWHCSKSDMTFIKALCTHVTIHKEKDTYKTEDWLLKKIDIDQDSEFKERRNWTIKEIQLAKDLLEKGFSVKEIAVKLNRRYDSVYDKIIYSEIRLIG